jgi:hypothetical protein
MGVFFNVSNFNFIMKKVVFVKMEGVLISENNYCPDKDRVEKFVIDLFEYCKKNSIRLLLISGYHESVAKKKFSESFLKKYFSEEQFIYVHDDYVNKKEDTDRKLHLENLKKDSEFNDSYFKQVEIKNFLESNNLDKKDILLLANDLWVDGFYTIKFSGVDFAICKENIVERGNIASCINGLAYFNFDFDSLKILIEDFPIVDTTALQDFIFKKMSEVLMKDVDFSGLVKKAAEKRLSDFNDSNCGAI